METFTWKLELKLNGVDWTDCTADVSLADGSIEVANGFNSTSLVDLLANPGSLKWIFDNSPANSAKKAGYYSPGHTNCRSGFAKNVKVRYSETYGGATLYYGPYWLKKPIPSPGVFGEAITRCQATDWLDLMTSEPMPILASPTGQRADQLLTTLLAAITTQPAGVEFNTGDSTFYIAFDLDNTDKDTVYSVLGKIARSEYGRIFLIPAVAATGGSKLVFTRRGYDAANNAPVGTISNVMDGVDILDNAGEIYDVFQVTMRFRYGFGSAIQITKIGNPIALAAYETRIFVLRFTDTNGSRITAGSYLSFVYKFGSTGDGSNDDRHANVTVTIMAYGEDAVRMRFVETAGAGGYINACDFTANKNWTDKTYTAEAGTSGLRSQALEMPYQSDPAEVEALAIALQAKSSNLTRRSCRVKFHANKSSTLMTYGFYSIINYCWTIVETQTALGSDFFIAGVKRTISPGNRLDVEWLCRPV
jgi:hypothetical protein